VHLATTMIQTTDKYKITWAVCMDLEANNLCGSWDRFLTKMLEHPAFRPMDIPRMSNNSVTTVDLKLRYKSEWISHGVFKAYSGEGNLSRVTTAVNEDALEKMGEREVNPGDLDMVIVIYAGTRVCAYSFGPGTPVMSLGPQATVFKLSYPEVTFEFRRVLKATKHTMGGDSDSFSFLLRDHTNGLNLRGQRTEAPSDWILISNPRGMGLGDTCEAARRGGGRVEGPDPIFEPAQLWNSHERWAGQNTGDLEDPRRVWLDDDRLPGAKRFQYDRYLALENPTLNFHVAFTRAAAVMPTMITNQTQMVLPDFQPDEARDIEVNVDHVRPWGMAAPLDLQVPAGRDSYGRPAWVGELTGPDNNWKGRALAPMEGQDFAPPDPPPLPEGIEPQESSGQQAAEDSYLERWSKSRGHMSSSGNQVPGERLSTPPPELAPTPEELSELQGRVGGRLQGLRLSTPPGQPRAPEADTEEPEMAPAHTPRTQEVIEYKREYLEEAEERGHGLTAEDLDERPHM
jgi:hypothetical protein